MPAIFAGIPPRRPAYPTALQRTDTLAAKVFSLNEVMDRPEGVGGTAPAYAAIVALTRTLSAELGPQGVRVLCLMPNAIPESALIRESFGRYAKAAGVTQAEFQARFEDMTHVRRLTTLDELANTAVFLASERASALTGTVVNLSGAPSSIETR